MVTSKSQLRITVVDTEGRRSSGTLSVLQPIVTVSPASGLRDKVSVRGQGFVVGKDSQGIAHSIDVYYGEERVKSIYPDSHGGFVTQFKVPRDVDSNAGHVVTAQVVRADVQANTEHRVPGPEIVLAPKLGTAGTVVKITGSGYPQHALIISVRVGIRQAIFPPLKTDDLGNFSVEVAVPDRVQLGQNTVSVSTPSHAASGQFIVVDNRINCVESPAVLKFWRMHGCSLFARSSDSV